MNRIISSKTLFWFLALAGVVLIGIAQPATGQSETATKEGDLTIEALLIWGTNDKTSPNPKHKALENGLAAKLSKSPLKWQKYFEEERKEIKVPVNGAEKVSLSKSAAIQVKNLGGEMVEVKLFGEGKFVQKSKNTLAGEEIMILGGDAKNDTAWFILLRQVPAKK